MPYPQNPIIFTILYAGQEYNLKTYWGEYRDLRALISDKLYLEDFGQCEGMGRCATCMIEIDGMDNSLSGKERNESTTLSKSRADFSAIRLSCQILINDELTNSIIKILEE